MPSIAAVWLAGTHDSDRSVARAAEASFKLAFPSDDKVKAVWRIFAKDIIQDSIDCILNETPQTLSDDRITSPDDAEAKYTRVMGTYVLVILKHLSMSCCFSSQRTQLTKSDQESNSQAPQLDSVQDVLQNEPLWALSCLKDPFLRRSVYRLLTLCLDKYRGERT